MAFLFPEKKYTSPMKKYLLFCTCLISGVILLYIFVYSRVLPESTLQSSVHDAISLVSPSVVMIVDEWVIGSGVLIDEQTILTSKHLIQADKKYAVRFSNNDIEWAVSISLKADSDLALLRLDNPRKWTFPIFISSQSLLRPGDFVLAFGVIPNIPTFIHNFGILSQMQQTVRVQEADFWGLLFTDIPLHAWYSGGPLVNLRGEIIGINTVFDAQGRFGGSTPIDNTLIQDWIRDIQ